MPASVHPWRDASLAPWLARASARLRWVHGSCGDLPPEQRAVHLTTELEHLSAELPVARRREALQELLLLFPGVESAPSPGTDELASVLGVPFYEAPHSLAELTDQLLKAWAGAGVEEQEQAIAALQAAGVLRPPDDGLVDLGDMGSMVWLDKSSRDSAVLAVNVLRARLDMDSDLPVDLQRLFRLMNTLVQQLERLDEMAWGVWGQVSKGIATRIKPGSFAGRSRLAERAGAYLSGQHRDRPEVFFETLETGVRLLTSLMHATGLGGGEFCHQLSNDLAPEEIERELRSQATRFRGISPEMCWTAYKDMMDRMSPAVLEQNLHACIANSVETLFHSSG